MMLRQLTCTHVMQWYRGDSTSDSEGCPVFAQPGGVATGSLRHVDTHHTQGQEVQSLSQGTHNRTQCTHAVVVLRL